MRKFAEETYYHLPYAMRSAIMNVCGYFLSRNRFGGKYEEYSKLFEHTQWLSEEKIQEFQANKLQEVIKAACRKVPYYKRLFSELRLTAEDVQTPRDLKKLPILEKETFRCYSSELLNEDIRNMNVTKRFSSGTTGQKLEFYLPTTLAYNINYALMYRFYNWAGIKRGDRRITLGGKLFTKNPPYWLYNSAENQLLLSIHHLNNETVDSYIKKVKRFSPVFIQGHPTGIFFLSQRMVESGISVSLKAVFTTGETLDQNQREVIMKAFNTEVFESYGLGESVVAAFECEEHNGFHVASEIGIMEFEKTESGLYNIIGTSLWNDAMPFIRYRIEDLVELTSSGKCTCGRGLPLKIKRVVGRIDDVIFSPQGTMILPVSIRMRIKPLIQLFENYQLQQLDKNEYTFLIQGNPDKSRKHRLHNILKEILGDMAQINIRESNTIMTGGGKARNIVNFYKH